MVSTNRLLLVALFACGVNLLCNAAFSQEETALMLGKAFEGQLREPTVYTDNIDEFRNSVPGFVQVFELSLEAEKTIWVDIEVKTKDRFIGFLLEDPAGARVSYVPPKRQQERIKISNLNADGTYKLTVISNRIGRFFVRVSEPAASKATVGGIAAIEDDESQKLLEEIQLLETLLARAKDRLQKHRQQKR